MQLSLSCVKKKNVSEANLVLFHQQSLRYRFLSQASHISTALVIMPASMSMTWRSNSIRRAPSTFRPTFYSGSRTCTLAWQANVPSARASLPAWKPSRGICWRAGSRMGSVATSTKPCCSSVLPCSQEFLQLGSTTREPGPSQAPAGPRGDRKRDSLGSLREEADMRTECTALPTGRRKYYTHRMKGERTKSQKRTVAA